jgi:pimeloyl-ACP methyl ester carboxylesterase
VTRFVMIHGAFAGGWVWGPLAEELAERGHTVDAPDLPGSGRDPTPVADVTLDAYARRICEAMAAHPEPAVLVGHSMGGMAITQAAPRCADRILSMVYVAAFLPQEGESLIGLTQLPEGEGDQVQANLVVSGDPPVATMPAEASRAATYAHCSDERAAWAIASRTPQPVFPFTEPVDLDGFDFDGIRRAYVFCGDDRAIPPPLQRRMMAAAGCDPVFELDTDHVPQLSRTAELAEILDSLAS